MKHPTAFLPVAMSSVALTVVLAHLVFVGVQREADEGAAAHLWQLLMVGQIPIVALFIARRFSQSPRVALLILTLQLVIALVAIAPVWLLRL